MDRFPPLQVLVVEDEMLIAMDIAFMLESAGHRVVGEAACLADLEEMPADTPLDLAFVDVHLARGSSGLEVSAHIQRCWPRAFVVFVTANPSTLPGDFAGAHGVIAKPFTTSGFKAAVDYLGEGIHAPPPVMRRPSSFVEAPWLSHTWYN